MNQNRMEKSTLGKMQQKYWTTKHSLVYKKLGIKQEDQCIVASDSDLDTKLELYQAIQTSCDDLLRIIENYQDRICILAHEENATGRFLKEHGKTDKTRAGKMMLAVGKTMSYTAQQRLSLRVPLVRLYQEVETFRNRAVVDCSITVNKMESSRTNYRGALLWMKDVSQELDPDTYKRLEKFRKVQVQVKNSKLTFDKLKLDTCQKIDLLSASRCNMFSRILATYQNTLIQFWEKTTRTLTHVSECFRGYQHYEFAMLKELTEPSKKLAEETSKTNSELDHSNPDEDDKDHSLFFDAEYHDEESSPNREPKEKRETSRSPSLLNLMDASMKLSEENLIDVAEQKNQSHCKSNEESHPLSSDLLSSYKGHDLLTNNPEIDDSEKDDLTLLNEILDIPTSNTEPVMNASSASTLTEQWLASFSAGNEPPREKDTNIEEFSSLTELENKSSDYLPSHLLDIQADFSLLNIDNDQGVLDAGQCVADLKVDQKAVTNRAEKQLVETGATKKKKDMSAWYGLFADLDPLTNPDAVGPGADTAMNEQRNC